MEDEEARKKSYDKPTSDYMLTTLTVNFRCPTFANETFGDIFFVRGVEYRCHFDSVGFVFRVEENLRG